MNKHQRTSMIIVALLLGALVGYLASQITIKNRVIVSDDIDSFEDCLAAGNPAMESYPRQCRTEDGKHFVEEIDGFLFEDEERDDYLDGELFDIERYAELSERESESLSECDISRLGDEIASLNLHKSESWLLSLYAVEKNETTTTGFEESTCGELGDLMQLGESETYYYWWTPLGCGYEVGEFFENETLDSKDCAEKVEEVRQAISE